MTASSYSNYLGAVKEISSWSSNYLDQPKSGLTITGSAMNDTLKDNFGGNTLVGGKGDDVYQIVDETTKITELAGGGVDTAVTWASYRLPTEVEVLNLRAAHSTGWASSAGSLIISDAERTKLVSGVGNDVLVDRAGGAQTFAFSKGGGQDVVYGFTTGTGYDHDAIELTNYGYTSFDQVKGLLSQVGNDTKISLPGGDVVLLKDVKASELTADNFHLQFDPSTLKLTFAEEFNSLSLYNSSNNTGTWRTVYNWGPESGDASIWARTSQNNGEKQIYVDANAVVQGDKAVGVNPFSINNGVLDITAARASDAVQSQIFGYDYTSGILTTEKSFSQKYGYFEIKAQMPSEAGMFPAFWLLNSNKTWPPELDVFENVGSNDVVQGYHTTDATTDKRPNTTNISTVDTAFHTYGLLWTPETISWYVDGVMTGSEPTPPDLHSEMYMLVNLAVGGHWAGDPDADFTSDSLKVDYIRAYSLEAASTGVKPGNGSNAGAGSGSTTPTTPAPPAAPAAPSDTVTAETTTTLSSTMKNLTLAGSKAVNGTGNALNNVITGNDAANLLAGLAGDDTLIGGGGNDTLNGGTGADILQGGLGDDAYYVDDARATIVEYAGEGADTIYSSVTYTAPANVEALVLTGTAAIDGRGGDGGVRISGNSAVNRLTGGAGNDILDGGKGIDVLEGGKGDDTYYVDAATEVVIEKAGEGIDTVYAGGSWKMADNVENLILMYTGDTQGTGNTLDNVITGNSGNNKLYGYAGFDTLIGGGGNDLLDGGNNNDVLTGGDGADTFVFGVKSGVDKVTDFGAGGRDALDLSAWYNAGYKATVYMVGADTWVTDGKGDTIILENVASNHLQTTATGFMFV